MHLFFFPFRPRRMMSSSESDYSTDGSGNVFYVSVNDWEQTDDTKEDAYTKGIEVGIPSAHSGETRKSYRILLRKVSI